MYLYLGSVMEYVWLQGSVYRVHSPCNIIALANAQTLL